MRIKIKEINNDKIVITRDTNVCTTDTFIPGDFHCEVGKEYTVLIESETNKIIVGYRTK
jgi:hypothetical protein